jgi:hypothetical protein
MRVYHDWEFLERGPGYPVVPLSVGMIREDGKTFYRIFAEAPWTIVNKHSWLKENVLPALDLGTITTNDQIIASTLDIREGVYRFLQDASADRKLELWGWYSAYDMLCLSQLFNSLIELPRFVPKWTNDIRQEAYRLDVRIPSMRTTKEIQHNALHDAIVELRMHEWLIGYERNLDGSV